MGIHLTQWNTEENPLANTGGVEIGMSRVCGSAGVQAVTAAARTTKIAAGLDCIAGL